MRILLFFCYVVFVLVDGNAQITDFKLLPKKEPRNCENGWCWGENPEIAKERYALFDDAYRYKNYQEALPHLDWLVENVPYLNKGIYIKGVKIYKELSKNVTDNEIKKKYLEREYQLYLKRDQYFGSERSLFKSSNTFKFLFSRYIRILAELDDFEEIKELYEQVLSGNTLFPPSTSFITFECLFLIRWSKNNLISDDFFYDTYFTFYSYVVKKEQEVDRIGNIEKTKDYLRWNRTRKDLEYSLINNKPYKELSTKTGYKNSFYLSLNAKNQSLSYLKKLNDVLLADNQESKRKAYQSFVSLFSHDGVKVPNDLPLGERGAIPEFITVEAYANQLKNLADSAISFRLIREPQLGRAEEIGDSLYIPVELTKRVVHKTSDSTYIYRLYPLKLIYSAHKEQTGGWLQIHSIELDSAKYKELAKNYVKEREEKYKGWDILNEDSGVLKEKYALFSDAIKESKYEETLNPLKWILDKRPDLHEAIYIKGISAYKALLKQEEDELKKRKLQDKILQMHDDRMKYFGDSANVLARKGALSYIYLNRRKDKNYKIELYDLYNTIFELNGMNTSRSNLTFLMVISTNLKVQKLISNTRLLKIFDEISKVVDYYVENTEGQEQQRWIKTQDTIYDYVRPSVPDLTCEYIEDKLGPDIINNPNDTTLQKRAIKYLLTARCLDNPLFTIAAQNLHKVQPDLGLAQILASDFLKKEKYDSAMIYYNQAIELVENDQAKIGKLTLEISKVEKARNNKVASREYALEALTLNPLLENEIYSLIGELYLSSKEDCAQGNPILSKAYVFAAYDMFKKAAHKEKMENVMQLFPTQEELNQSTYKVGDTIPIGCWIGGEVEVRVK